MSSGANGRGEGVELMVGDLRLAEWRGQEDLPPSMDALRMCVPRSLASPLL